MNNLFRIGGFVNFLLLLFHMLFWKLFNWQTELTNLSMDNRAIMQVLNIHIIYILAVFIVMNITGVRYGTREGQGG